MKAPLAVFLASLLAISLLPGEARAGQIWTDGNGDGLPDAPCPGTLPAAPSSNVTFGVWIDSQSFVWTNYLVYVEWTAGCLSYVSAQYVITGGTNFPMDQDVPPAFGGTGYNESGVDHIGNMTLHVDTPVNCCVAPSIVRDSRWSLAGGVH